LIPFSTRQPRRAVRGWEFVSRPASGRSRFGVWRPPRPRCRREPRSACARPCGFSLLTGSPRGLTSWWHSFVRRTLGTRRLMRVPSSSIRRASAVGVTDLPHARDESNRSSRAAGDLVARAGSCTDASFSAVFRYPRAQAVARPGRTSGSSLAHQAIARSRFSSGGAPGVLPFAGLIPLTGGHARLRRAAKPFSDISVRPGPRVVRAGLVRPDLFSSG